MRKFLYMLAVLLVLIGISTNDVEARQDVYATTYLGNNWYVDQDSVKRVGDILNFTVYTTAGLSYKVTSSDDNYYNADVFYDNNKLVSDNGQSVWKSPGMMAAMRVARRQTRRQKQSVSAFLLVLEKANSPSLPLGSQIKRKGHFLISIKFRDEPDATTRLAIQLDYRDNHIYRQTRMNDNIAFNRLFIIMGRNLGILPFFFVIYFFL